MRPKGLGANGRQAWRTACAGLEAAGLDPALTIGALERYARSADRLAVVEATWIKLGQPVTTEGSKGQLVAHPLLRELRDETRAVHELAKALQPAAASGWRRGPGRRRRSARAQIAGRRAAASLRRGVPAR